MFGLRLRQRDITDARLAGFRELADYRARPDNSTAALLILAVPCPECEVGARVPCSSAYTGRDGWHRGWLHPDERPRFHARRVALAETVAGAPLWRPPRGGHEAHLAVRDALEDLVEAAQVALDQTSLHPKITRIPDLTSVWDAVARLTDAEARGGYR